MPWGESMKSVQLTIRTEWGGDTYYERVNLYRTMRRSRATRKAKIEENARGREGVEDRKF